MIKKKQKKPEKMKETPASQRVDPDLSPQTSLWNNLSAFSRRLRPTQKKILLTKHFLPPQHHIRQIHYEVTTENMIYLEQEGAARSVRCYKELHVAAFVLQFLRSEASMNLKMR